MLRNYLFFILLTGLLTGSMAEEKTQDSVVDMSALIDVSGLVEKVSDKRVVYVGETHDQYQHHLNQLAIIKGLHAKHSDLAIGLEFFFQPYQKVLDQYIAGEIDEAGLIRGSDYFNRWRFDYRLYRPIFSFAREHGIPMIALNLEREITDQVSREGIESLSPEQQARLPAEIARDNESYRERLQTIYEAHPHREGRDFERFLDVQLLWDESMAERAAEWIEENPQGHLVILAGAGHLIYGDGIPSRLSRRVDASQAIVLNVNSVPELNPELADYLILADQHKLPPSGKLGVFLDVESSPPSVNGFVENSGAAEAGIKEKDLLVSVDDQPIESYAELRIALMDREVGEVVKLSVKRERLVLGTIVETYQVTLR
ncbi:MAG: ChaN family lipoprotein [Candidatus Thiodiazotropha lotti]|nr:ChaN family lipoprotein [Candidatus Thiodiazotropha lotti]MCW4219162.1 ChaN family lipoprotein [Candidatus Thiodiazotropha lotti]